MNGGLSPTLFLLEHAYLTMQRNLAMTFRYTLPLLPASITCLLPYGWLLNSPFLTFSAHQRLCLTSHCVKQF